MWTLYKEERLTIVPAICINEMDIWTSVVSLIFFEMVELHCLDQVDINMTDALNAITRWGKNDDYDWLSHHGAYVPQWDVRRNGIFTKMQLVITDKKYLIWYMNITRRVITLNPE